VQIPVRPGYEEAIAHYMKSDGELWDGGDPPHVDDELYVSIIDEIKEQQRAEVGKTDGTLTVTQGSTSVTGSGTAFDADDEDRSITIDGERYRIDTVASPTDLTLRDVYRGSTRPAARYTIGAKYMGEPWEVRIPTSLVMLQADSSLPDWTT
jgi:hypothetical protein